MAERIGATHGTVCALPRDRFGYFGWPTVARMDDGTLVAAASGMRSEHVCPYGRTTLFISRDQGATWSSPRVIHDSPLDDRDAGVVCSGGRGLLVSWFAADPRRYGVGRSLEARAQEAAPGLVWVTDENVARWQGSWVMASDDLGDTWRPAVRVPLTAPHGPIHLRDGGLLYLGKDYGSNYDDFAGGVGATRAMRSDDGGRTWRDLGAVPLHADTINANYHEAHVAELPAGKLVGMIRFQLFGQGDELKRQQAALERHRLTNFSVMQTESNDGGRTWSPGVPTGFPGSPPHVMVHSSGALVCVYGHRQQPYGERAAISRDGGRTWTHVVLRDDGPDQDLDYPSSVELSDGSIFTLYYQKPSAVEDKPALLWTRWRLPAG